MASVYLCCGEERNHIIKVKGQSAIDKVESYSLIRCCQIIANYLNILNLVSHLTHVFNPRRKAKFTVSCEKNKGNFVLDD